MKIIIVGHASRIGWIALLQRKLGDTVAYVDYSDQGAFHSHMQALQIAAQHDERCIIMEDDAIPVVDFYEQANEWFARFPDDLISFYLGTSRPPQWQPEIERKLTSDPGADFITIPTLIHAVCYSIPADKVQYVLGRALPLKDHMPEADFAIGAGWSREVIYPVESLVEHRDGTPIERHPDGKPRTEPRVARKLAGPLAYER